MFESIPGVVPGFVTGGMAGFAARGIFGPSSSPCRSSTGTAYAVAVTGGWFAMSESGHPMEAEWVAGAGFGYLIGTGLRSIVEILRHGFGRGGDWGGGGGWEPPEPPEPWGSGPTDFTGTKPAVVVEVPRSRGLHDLMGELESAPPAPSETSEPMIPVGR